MKISFKSLGKKHNNKTTVHFGSLYVISDCHSKHFFPLSHIGHLYNFCSVTIELLLRETPYYENVFQLTELADDLNIRNILIQQPLTFLTDEADKRRSKTENI